MFLVLYALHVHYAPARLLCIFNKFLIKKCVGRGLRETMTEFQKAETDFSAETWDIPSFKRNEQCA